MQRAEKSAAICQHIAGTPEWRAAKIIALFAPLPGEPDIDGLWAHAAGKTLAYPRMHDEQLSLYSVPSLRGLHAARWGIREPSPDAALLIAPENLDLILVPGIAFTPAGERCGRGGGFYDRLLATLPARTPRIGVCYALQVIPTIPSEPHDQTVHAIITE